MVVFLKEFTTGTHHTGNKYLLMKVIWWTIMNNNFFDMP